jgi:hypothetical protein
MTTSSEKATVVPKWLWLVLTLGQLAFLSWSINQQAWFFPDSDRYAEAAHNLWAHGELYARPWPATVPTGQAVQEYSIRPPGYPLLVLLLGGAEPGKPPLLLLIVQNLLSLLNLSLVLRCWARWARPATKSWYWVLALVLWPAQFIYANALMSEIFLQTALLVLALSGLDFCREPLGRHILRAALALSVALLLKPVFGPFVGVFAVVAAALAWRFRRPAWVLVAMLPLLLSLAYMSWNQQRTGYFHFSSISDINLLHYNAAGVVRQEEGPAAEGQWVATVLQEADTQADFASRQHFIQRRAVAVLRAHPLVYARQHLQGMVTFFLDPGRFDLAQFLRLAPPPGGGLLEQLRAAGTVGVLRTLQGLPLGLLVGLLALAVANTVRLGLAIRGFWRAGSREAELRWGRWWLAVLILYVAFLTGPLGAARFLVPVWPLLLMLALCGLKLPASVAQEVAPVGEHQR